MRLLIVLPGTDSTYPPGALPAIVDGRRDVMKQYVRAETVVDVGALKPGALSMHAPGGTAGKLALMAGPMVERVRQAEADSYDAAVIYGQLDPGAEAARSFVQIPVVGTGRAALLTAAALGDSFGSMVYESALVPAAQRMVRAYGMEARLTSIRAIGIPPTETRARADEVRRRMIDLSRRAIDEEGAEVIVPLGFSMVPTVVQADELAAAIGAPVVDGLIAAVRLAETLALLKMSQSPLAYPPTAAPA